MLILPVNCMYGIGSNSLLTYDEAEYNSNSSRVALAYSDNRSLFRIKCGSALHYLEPYFFGVYPGAKFKIEFEGRKLSGSPSIDIQMIPFDSDMKLGNTTSGMYNFPITETYFKKYKIIVAMPEGINANNTVGILFNIRTTATNCSWDMRNLNIDIIDNPGNCNPRLKVKTYDKCSFDRMLNEAKLLIPSIQMNVSYNNGVIYGSGSNFKGIIEPIDNTLYNNKIMISGEYMATTDVELATNFGGSIILPANNAWSKFTKVLDTEFRKNAIDAYVSVGTSNDGTVQFKNLKIIDVKHDDTFI